MSERQAVSLAHGYLLHARPYRDSSAIAEFFIKEHGRIAVVARGVRRPKSAMKGQLQPFCPLLVSWVSRGSLGTLTQLERGQGASLHGGRNLLSAFYINELILRAIQSGDSQPEVFVLYQNCLKQLASGSNEAGILRVFERDLLQCLGYGLQLTTDADGQAIDANARYHYDAQEGAVLCAVHRQDNSGYNGATLKALCDGKFDSPQSYTESKRLLRAALDRHLGPGLSRVRHVMSSMNHHRRSWSASNLPAEPKR